MSYFGVTVPKHLLYDINKLRILKKETTTSAEGLDKANVPLDQEGVLRTKAWKQEVNLLFSLTQVATVCFPTRRKGHCSRPSNS